MLRKRVVMGLTAMLTHINHDSWSRSMGNVSGFEFWGSSVQIDRSNTKQEIGNSQRQSPEQRLGSQRLTRAAAALINTTS